MPLLAVGTPLPVSEPVEDIWSVGYIPEECVLLEVCEPLEATDPVEPEPWVPLPVGSIPVVVLPEAELLPPSVDMPEV